jgi:hypothetical protein
LPSRKIVAHRLAENLFARREIQNIVDQLEGDAQVPGVLAELRFRGFIRAIARDRA